MLEPTFDDTPVIHPETQRRAARRALPILAVTLAFLALVWGVIGAVAQPRALSAYRTDYEVANSGRSQPVYDNAPSLAEAQRTGNEFARNYEKLEDSGYFMAPARALKTWQSHKAYVEAVGRG